MLRLKVYIEEKGKRFVKKNKDKRECYLFPAPI